jgi:hypothetical protein
MKMAAVLVAFAMVACDKRADVPGTPPATASATIEAVHVSVMDTCKAICEARERVKELTVQHDELQRDVDALKLLLAVRGVDAGANK